MISYLVIIPFKSMIPTDTCYQLIAYERNTALHGDLEKGVYVGNKEKLLDIRTRMEKIKIAIEGCRYM